jgi:hypothetical protein
MPNYMKNMQEKCHEGAHRSGNLDDKKCFRTVLQNCPQKKLGSHGTEDTVYSRVYIN